ncbi:site-specific integrase [Clostridium beijerinckii]|uniref:Integrase n=1 Tax=Clostridium beijerinckii TaxID=1520 RepID=A0AAX0B0Q6_CLOBE|nr:site-specific integrase [Clostridium beijerinckii]NRT88910.1 integrase [Clostridium beijerinckii]NYC74365.1 integrase [Clostridium beijerinckii]
MNQNLLTKTGKNGIQWSPKKLKDCLLLLPNSVDTLSQNLPITSKINFNDDFWDFSDFNTLNKSNNYYKYNFTGIPHPFKFYIKIRLLKNLYIKDNACTTAKQKFKSVKNFFIYLEKKHITNYQLIDIEVLESYFSQFKNVNEKCIADKKAAIKEIFEEIEIKNSNNIIEFDCIYDYLTKCNKKLMAAELEEGKHPLIHFTMLNKIVSLAIKDMNNNQLPKIYRMVACMIIILAETGMRIGEFHKLQINKLTEIKHTKQDEIFYCLNFLTYKTTPEKDGRWVYSFMTDKALLAYRTLTKLTDNDRNLTNSPYLFLNKFGKIFKNQGNLSEYNIGFFIRHQSDLGFQNLSEVELKNYSTYTVKKYIINKICWGNLTLEEVGERYYFVTPHQYRVTCATKLYSDGYRLDWIRIHMNHLTETMTSHYIRINQIEKEKKNLANTLNFRLNKEAGILETDLNKITDANIRNELLDKDFLEDYNSINKFLVKLKKKKKSLNIYSDIDEIIDILFINKSPIIETELGFCARNALVRLCERQKYINSAYDGYYIGIHIPTIESLPFNFKRYKEKIKVINHNKRLYEEDSRYHNQYQIEVKGMQMFVTKRLLPELKLLQTEIETLGFKDVINKYENIDYIASEFKHIVEEVSQWDIKK